MLLSWFLKESIWKNEVFNEKEKRDGLMLLIKAGHEASYQKIIDAVDEALINAVKKYALVKAAPEELEWMSKQH